MKEKPLYHLILDVLANGRGAQGLFSTSTESKAIWFENRIVAEFSDIPALVKVKVGQEERTFSAFARGASTVRRKNFIEQHAELDFGVVRGNDIPHGFYDTFVENAFAGKSVFRNQEYDGKPLPPEEAWSSDVPRVIWDGQQDAVDCFARAFEIVGGKIRKPENGSPFCRNFVYTEFANAVFIWGNCFITMFGKYASHIFPFIEILNNFYRCQASDGFIARQINIADGSSAFERNDPSATGGNIFAWAEWENFCVTNDKERLREVFPALVAYHHFLNRKRTWQNGTYFASGWGSGMDNIPRIDETKYNVHYDHGHVSFIDVTLQQILNAKMLLKIASEIGETEGIDELKKEAEQLTRFVNEHMWDETVGIYKDLDRDGKLLPTIHIGAFWALLAQVAPPERAERMVKLLENPAVFSTPCGTASLAVCDPHFVADGGEYWRGGVWCITEYMVVRGLQSCGFNDAAFRLAKKNVLAIAEVFHNTHTIWESYDPSRIMQGSNEGGFVRKEFVGFSGVTPIAMLIEAVFGIRLSASGVIWEVRLLERHGIENLHFGRFTLTMTCEKRDCAGEPPKITLISDNPISILVVWAGGEMIVDATPGHFSR